MLSGMLGGYDTAIPTKAIMAQRMMGGDFAEFCYADARGIALLCLHSWQPGGRH